MITVILGKKKYPILRKDKWLRMILRDKNHVIQVRWMFSWIDVKVEVMSGKRTLKLKQFVSRFAADNHYNEIKSKGKINALNMI